MRHLQGGATICWHCLEWHYRALRMLAGDPPWGCQECGVTFADLESATADGNVSMYMHTKDGIYQVLCRQCSDAYERKRLDLFGGTVYGHLKKLKGTK